MGFTMTKQTTKRAIAKSSNGTSVKRSAKAKPGKVIARAKSSKAVAVSKPGVGVTFDTSAKIVFVGPNGKRGASRERFAKYRKGSTVAACMAIKGGPNRGDVKYDLAKGFIKLSR
jgi:hypothetical protein